MFRMTLVAFEDSCDPDLRQSRNRCSNRSENRSESGFTCYSFASKEQSPRSSPPRSVDQCTIDRDPSSIIDLAALLVATLTLLPLS